MPNQFKTRMQAIDEFTVTRRWVELEVQGDGIVLTIQNPTIMHATQDEDFEVVAKVHIIRDQFIGFIIGYLISGIGAYDKTIRDLVISISKQIVEKLDMRG